MSIVTMFEASAEFEDTLDRINLDAKGRGPKVITDVFNAELHHGEIY